MVDTTDLKLEQNAVSSQIQGKINQLKKYSNPEPNLNILLIKIRRCRDSMGTTI